MKYIVKSSDLLFSMSKGLVKSISPNDLELSLGISFRFSSPLHLSRGQQLVKTISISADDDFSPLKRYILRHRNMFILNVNKYKNRLYIQKYH